MQCILQGCLSLSAVYCLPGDITDPLGRRIAKKINGNIVEKYLWKGKTTLLAVYDGNDNLLMRFMYADARAPLAMTKGGLNYYLCYDQVGSLRLVTDTFGNVVKEIDYDSFGNVLADSDPSFTVPFGFAGGLYDVDTGLVHFGARDYDPDTGMWTAKDPILFKGRDTNLFGYVLKDPVNLIDPLGLIYNPYSWKALTGDVAGLAGLSAIAAGFPAIGVPLVFAAVGLELWEAFTAPSEIETLTNKELAPMQKAFQEEQDDIKKLEQDLKPKNGGTCPLRF